MRPLTSPTYSPHPNPPPRRLKYNLGNLSAIAAANGGNRAFGLPGYKASVDYVLGRIERAGLKGSVQEFTGYFTQTNNMTFTVDGVSYDTATFDGTPSTPNASFVTAPLVLIPDTGSGAGCVAADYAGIVATGKIVLVQRGKCGFGDKAALAKAQGAVSTIIYNNAPGIVQGGSLDEGDFTPVGMILQADGLALAQRLKTGEVVTGNFLVDALGEYRTTWNVIAETKGGNPNKVVVVSLAPCRQSPITRKLTRCHS